MHVNTSRNACIWYWFGDHGQLEIGGESFNVTLAIPVCNVEYGFMGVNQWSLQTSSNSFHLLKSQLTFKHRKICLHSVRFHSCMFVVEIICYSTARNP